jgi:P-type Ca2+ transporter type 2C
VGFATVGIFIQWYLNHGVTFEQLRHWGHCLNWGTEFSLQVRPKTKRTDILHYVRSDAGDACVAVQGLDLANQCDVFTSANNKAQTLSLSVLVTMEMLKALSAVSLDNSLLRVPPWMNPWLIAGVILPFSIHLSVVYFPVLNQVFGVSSLTADEWVTVLKWAAPILLLDEVLKAIGRTLGVRETQERKRRRELEMGLAGGSMPVPGAGAAGSTPPPPPGSSASPVSADKKPPSNPSGR